MQKNKIYALIIAAAVMLGPFRFAFMQIDLAKPLFTVVMFLLTVGGSLAAILISMSSSK